MMNVIETKQYSLRDQPFYKLLGLSVGLVDSDNQNLSFYSQKLEQANLAVKKASNLIELKDLIIIEPVDVVIFSPQIAVFDKELMSLRSFMTQNPSLPVITMAQTMQEMQIDAIMKLGARLHINRDLSHPRDILVALEQLLI